MCSTVARNDFTSRSQLAPASTSHAEIRRVPGLGYSIAGLLDHHSQLYLRHIEISFLSYNTNDYPDFSHYEVVACFLDGLYDRVFRNLAKKGVDGQGQIHFRRLPSEYAEDKTVLQVLLILRQDWFHRLGSREQSAEQVLDALIAESWLGVQAQPLLHPTEVSSAIRGVGSLYLSADEPVQGAQALSAMMALCRALRKTRLSSRQSVRW